MSLLVTCNTYQRNSETNLRYLFLRLWGVSWPGYLELISLRICLSTICQHQVFGGHSSPTLGNTAKVRPKPSHYSCCPDGNGQQVTLKEQRRYVLASAVRRPTLGTWGWCCHLMVLWTEPFKCEVYMGKTADPDGTLGALGTRLSGDLCYVSLSKPVWAEFLSFATPRVWYRIWKKTGTTNNWFQFLVSFPKAKLCPALLFTQSQPSNSGSATQRAKMMTSHFPHKRYFYFNMPGQKFFINSFLELGWPRGRSEDLQSFKVTTKVWSYGSIVRLPFPATVRPAHQPPTSYAFHASVHQLELAILPITPTSFFSGATPFDCSRWGQTLLVVKSSTIFIFIFAGQVLLVIWLVWIHHVTTLP